MAYTVIKTYKIKQVDKRDTSTHSFRDITDVITIATQDFMPLTFPNGNLMTMFAPTGETKQWPKGLLSIIRNARNAKTEEIMANHLRASDPMSEQALTLPTEIKARAKLFHEAKVPAVLSITMGQYMNDDGDVIAPCELNVTSHPKQYGTPAIELIGANIEWLGLMCSRTYEDSGDDQDLLEMVKTWLPPDVSIVANIQRTKHAMPYYLRTRRNACTTMRAVAIEGLVSHDLKEYIDEQVMELFKKADGKAKSSASVSASGSKK